jgi:hypothetical protein
VQVIGTEFQLDLTSPFLNLQTTDTARSFS